jgi:hypothetical protein
MLSIELILQGSRQIVALLWLFLTLFATAAAAEELEELAE